MTWWHRHKWGKWEVGTATHASVLFKAEWESSVQVRRCETCGKYKIRTLL